MKHLRTERKKPAENSRVSKNPLNDSNIEKKKRTALNMSELNWGFNKHEPLYEPVLNTKFTLIVPD